MRPSRRKAAEESQKKVRKMLKKDLEVIDSDSVLSEQVDSDNRSGEENARQVQKLTIGTRKKSKAAHVNQLSKGKTPHRNIANNVHVLDQNDGNESEADDSDYRPEDHLIENENINISDSEEIAVTSTVEGVRSELKKTETPRRSKRTNYRAQSNDNEKIDISDNDEIMVISSDAEATNESKRIKASKMSKRNRKTKGRKSKKPKKHSCSRAGIADLDWEVWEKELQGWGPWGNDGEIDLDALVQKKVPADVKEPPPELLMPLLPFQKEWLAWSLKQEGSEFRGGILADEMGMGKTIQAISLILTSRALRLGHILTENSPPALPAVGGVSCTTTKVLPQIKATLVVCPLVAVIQWRNEIARFTAEGSTKVLVYHGASRCRDPAELAQYDIVLTTYSIVELEHRRNLMPAKEKCQWCCRLFYPDRLVVHLRFFCGPTAVKSEKQAKQLKKKARRMVSGNMSKTKSIDKKNVVEDDICKNKVKGRPKGKGSLKDKGETSVFACVTGRKRKAEALEKEADKVEDISFNKSFKGKSNGRGRRKKKENMDADSLECANDGSHSSGDIGLSVLHSVKWDRIILDEAHFIKDRRCSTSKAVFSLESSYKWALSGTPLQNRVGELYSLIRFLRIYPYSYYFCRRCDCKSLDYSFGKEWRKCDHCGHSPLHHFCWWNKFVANPIKKWGYVNEGRKAMILLKYKVLDSAVLRRTKSERAADLALPPRTAFLRRDMFDAREEDFYQALYTQSQSQFNTYITAGTLLNNYAHIFDLLTRLRQAVDHPYLVVYSRTASPLDQNGTFDLSSAKEVCGICHDQLEDAVSAGCGHTFCRVCIQEHTSAAGQSSCPSCLKPLTVDLTIRNNSNNQQNGIKVKGYRRSSIINRINIENFQTSTKIDALREEIMHMLQKDAAAKAIVFSQFTSFLDLISFCLMKSGIKCAQLVGNMSIQARDQTIEKFTNDPDCRVFLMSLKAGGVALNLTVASYVFLMDPWWNPAVEQQAQDRIHRLGQYKPIRVVRFVIANTIEERILRLQEKKQLVFEGTVGGSSEALGRLTEDDLRFLFTN